MKFCLMWFSSERMEPSETSEPVPGGGGNHDQAAAHFEGLCEVGILDQGTGVEAQDVDALGAVHVGAAADADNEVALFATQIS